MNTGGVPSTNSHAPFGGTGAHVEVKWDIGNRRSIYYENAMGSGHRIQAFLGGTVPGPVITPLGDFAGATSVDVWDVTGTPNGGIVAAAVVQYSQKRVEHKMLLYDSTGRLTDVWDTYPYHHHRIVMDEDRNVYALGDRVDSPAGSYPILIKYSEQGSVLGELLPSTAVPLKNGVIDGTAPISLATQGKEVVAYLGNAHHVFRFGSNGVRKADFTGRAAIPAIAANPAAIVSGIGLLPNGDLIVQVVLKEKTVTGRLAADGSSWRTISAADRGTLVGADSAGTLWFVRGGPASTVIDSMTLAELP